MKDKTLKQLVKIYNAVVQAINEVNEEASLAATGEPEDFDDDRKVLPCIRILSNGNTETYNCKTGETIP